MSRTELLIQAANVLRVSGHDRMAGAVTDIIREASQSVRILADQMIYCGMCGDPTGAMFGDLDICQQLHELETEAKASLGREGESHLAGAVFKLDALVNRNCDSCQEIADKEAQAEVDYVRKLR